MFHFSKDESSLNHNKKMLMQCFNGLFQPRQIYFSDIKMLKEPGYTHLLSFGEETLLLSDKFINNSGH